MKSKLTALYVTIVGIIVLQCNSIFEKGFGRPIYDHLIEKGYAETGSENLVTAVYLFYRYYDTLFEALMLLLSIIAVIYMSAHGSGDYNE
jgi:multicomponent Na+:H+ antiporter subunit B